ncbi:hypothetical protein ABEG17_05335 [Pedococcus sp. KACC 23699]|uniref:Universal stress protein n=1 Tax=Pedococcus sp. KACC 23699 TaxID=3149228 RepID=A0AAU7JWV5_9MICO
MQQQRRTRVLVVTDSATPSLALLRAVAERAAADDVQLRLVVLNPAKAELHLLHPERHDKAFEAECVLLETLPQLEAAAGAPVIGSVSIRHDPVDAIEETVLGEPVDEILLALPVSVTRPRPWWHHDLADRLRRFGVPVAEVDGDENSSRS